MNNWITLKGFHAAEFSLVVAKRKKYKQSEVPSYFLRSSTVTMSSSEPAQPPVAETSSIDPQITTLLKIIERQEKIVSAVLANASIIQAQTIQQHASGSNQDLPEQPSQGPQTTMPPVVPEYQGTPLYILQNRPPPVVIPDDECEYRATEAKSAIDEKLAQQIESLQEEMMRMKGLNTMSGTRFKDLCFYPNAQLPTKFKCLEFEKYKGIGCPLSHLKLYCILYFFVYLFFD